MAQAFGNGKSNQVNANINGEREVKTRTFHDFLGNKGQESIPAAVCGGRPPPEISPSGTSDLGSERNASTHLEGIPFYGSRGDITGQESGKTFTGYKRSNSDSFMLSSRDKLAKAPADSQDSPSLTKLLRYPGGDRAKRPYDEETPFNLHHMRPNSSSFVSQTSNGARIDADISKWDRVIPQNTNPVLQYPPRSNQLTPFSYHQGPSQKYKDTNFSPHVVTHTAADEGSRTGIKGSGILSAINATGTLPGGRQPSGVLIRSGKAKPIGGNSEVEASAMASQRGNDLEGRQMTIFYRGQAHVFDNVHPNKADVIMALAGSNGGSWSTTYKPKPSDEANRTQPPVAENDVVSRELNQKTYDKRDSNNHGLPSDAIGSSYQGSLRGKEKMEGSVQIQAANIGKGDEKH